MTKTMAALATTTADEEVMFFVFSSHVHRCDEQEYQYTPSLLQLIKTKIRKIKNNKQTNEKYENTQSIDNVTTVEFFGKAKSHDLLLFVQFNEYLQIKTYQQQHNTT